MGGTQIRDTAEGAVTLFRIEIERPGLNCKYSHLADETDAGLLVFVALRAEDEDLAREAGAEFYRRHAQKLYRHCHRAYADIFGEGWVIDLVHETFERAYLRAEKFTDGGWTEHANVHLRARGWLHAIAINLVRDRQRPNRGYVETFLSDEQWAQVPSDDAGSTDTDSAELTLVREALASLSEREQDVLRVTFLYHKPGEEHQRLPNEVARDLAAIWDTTPENLRQIRRRAMKKVQDFVESRTVTGGPRGS